MIFSDRAEAGRFLAKAMEKYKSRDAVIYALPKGGVVVAAEVARAFGKPLDLIIIRKIGHPYNPEYAIGAVSSRGQLVYDQAEVARVNPDWFTKELEGQKVRAKEQYRLYLGDKKPLSIQGKIAIIVDDGIATGLSMKAAVKELKAQSPQKIVIATPVIPKDTAQELKAEADKLIALEIPEDFAGSVGAYYRNFPQVSDKEVINLLQLLR